MNTFISWRKVFFWSIFIINLKWLKQKLHKNFSVSGHFQFPYYQLSLKGLLKKLGHSVVSEVTDPALKVLGCRKKIGEIRKKQFLDEEKIFAMSDKFAVSSWTKEDKDRSAILGPDNIKTFSA